MNGLDVALVLAAICAGVGGFRLGLVTRVTSWVGMVVGIVGGTLALPWLVDRFAGDMDRADAVVLSASVVLASGFLGQALGVLVGSRLHLAIPEGKARTADRAGGALAGVLGIGLMAWLFVPAIADVPDWPAEQARGSSVMGFLDRNLPEPPDASRSLRRLLGDRYPRVFDGLAQAPDVGPPPASSGLDDTTARRVAASTVKVIAEACDQIHEGSGFVVAEGLVATNAHVVAGAVEVEVESDDGTTLAGVVVAFDPDRDLALVSVPELDRDPLPLDSATEGGRGAVFGHPGGAPLRLAPYVVGRSLLATGTDIYDRRQVDRDVLVLAAELAPGDSGSALVDPDGEVVGVAFAIAPDRPRVAYALDVSELRAVLATRSDGPVDAGACIV